MLIGIPIALARHRSSCRKAFGDRRPHGQNDPIDAGIQALGRNSEQPGDRHDRKVPDEAQAEQIAIGGSQLPKGIFQEPEQLPSRDRGLFSLDRILEVRRPL
jgi:hypothetical protein